MRTYKIISSPDQEYCRYRSKGAKGLIQSGNIADLLLGKVLRLNIHFTHDALQVYLFDSLINLLNITTNQL